MGRLLQEVFGCHPLLKKWEEALSAVVMSARAGQMQSIGVATQAVQQGPSS